MKDNLIYIRHILDAINKIEDYTNGIKKNDFISSPKTQDAVIRQFEIIGEATKKLAKTFRDKYPEIP